MSRFGCWKCGASVGAVVLNGSRRERVGQDALGYTCQVCGYKGFASNDDIHEKSRRDVMAKAPRVAELIRKARDAHANIDIDDLVVGNTFELHVAASDLSEAASEIDEVKREIDAYHGIYLLEQFEAKVECLLEVG
jgi:hypothetical protein